MSRRALSLRDRLNHQAACHPEAFTKQVLPAAAMNLPKGDTRALARRLWAACPERSRRMPGTLAALAAWWAGQEPRAWFARRHRASARARLGEVHWQRSGGGQDDAAESNDPVEAPMVPIFKSGGIAPPPHSRSGGILPPTQRPNGVTPNPGSGRRIYLAAGSRRSLAAGSRPCFQRHCSGLEGQPKVHFYRRGRREAEVRGGSFMNPLQVSPPPPRALRSNLLFCSTLFKTAKNVLIADGARLVRCFQVMPKAIALL